MATITAGANGNWSSTGTWVGGVVPGNGDIGILSTFNVTVDVNTIIGTSGAAGTLVVDATSTGALSVAAGVTFTVRGDLQYGNNAFTVGAGATYLFDSSLASGTPVYKLIHGNNVNQQNTKFVTNGTSVSPVTFDNAVGSGRGITARWASGGSAWAQCNCQWTNFNNLADTGASKVVLDMNVLNASLAEMVVNHCSFTNCGWLASPGVAATNDFVWTFTEVKSSAYSNWYLWLSALATTTGKRIFTDNVAPVGNAVTAAPTLYFSGSYKNYTFDRNVLGPVNTTSPSDSLPFASFKDNMLVRNGSINSLGNAGDLFQYNYLFQEGAIASNIQTCSGLANTGTTTWDGMVCDVATDTDDADLGRFGFPSSGAQITALTRWLSVPNARGNTPGKSAAHGGIGMSIKLYHNTVMFGENVSPATRALGAYFFGSGYYCKTDMVQVLRDNLAWSTTHNSSTGDYLAFEDQVGSWSGIADSGTVNTIVDANPSPAFPSGSTPGFAPNALVVITANGSGTGPAVGESSYLTSQVTSTLTLTTALSAAPDNQTGYIIIAYATVTAAEARCNAMFNANTNTILNKTGGGSTAVLGMSGMYVVNPATFMSDTINLGTGTNYTTAGPMFKAPTRNWALFDTVYLGNSAATWSSAGGVVNVGDFRQSQTTGHFGNANIRFRAIQQHNMNTASSQPGSSNSTSAIWRNYWEYATSYDARIATLAGSTWSDSTLRGYDGLPLVNANFAQTVSAWVRDGFMPTNPLVRATASDGTTIGAVPYWAPGGSAPGLTGRLDGYLSRSLLAA